jgi:GT2 family glycosyltransferase
MNFVSFIIPHRGREGLLRETIASVARQNASVDFDIIVVTQNQVVAPETLAAAGEVPTRVISVDTALTISALRNIGVKNTCASHFAFLDADIALSENWLQAMLQRLESDASIVVTSAVQISSDEPTELERIRVALSNAAIDTAVAFLPGRNLLLTRETFDAVGGFPEHLQTCEDYYFTDRAAKLGQLWYSSDASYIHLGEDTRLDEMFAKEIWRGQSNLQSMRGRPVALREWPSFLVPLWISLALPVAAVLTLAGATLAALLAVIAAVLPFAMYVTRLYVLANREISLRHIIAFYAYYFPARAWGTIRGAFGSIGRNLHDG